MATASGSNAAARTVKVLLLEKVHKDAEMMLVKEGFTVIRHDKLSDAELMEIIPDISVIGVRSKTQITAKVLQAAKNLMAIGCFCIGTDQTDLAQARKLGIPVFNSPYSNTRSVSELIIAEMVMLARQAGDRSMEAHRGIWNKRSNGCYEVRGKTLGIIGYGHVGSQLSVLAESMGMTVVFFDIVPKLAMGNARALGSVEEVLRTSDFVSLHVPGTQHTANMIREEQIAMMKDGAYLLNASRGNVVDVEAAAKALRLGKLAGGAFDVFPEEPAGDDPFTSPLQNCPNTILTPHIGGSTEEAQQAIGRDVAGKLIDFMSRGSTFGAVNVPEIGVSWNLQPGQTRITTFHHNVPGVLRDINAALSVSNVSAQHLGTMLDVGYMLADLDAEMEATAYANLCAIKANTRVRILRQGPGYQGDEIKSPQDN